MVTADLNTMLDEYRESFDWKWYSARASFTQRYFGWTNRIPLIGSLVSAFWTTLYTEGPYQTMKPRWGALTFAFLNDGIKPTMWHTVRSITHDNMDKYTGIYTMGAPKSLAVAQKFDEALDKLRANGLDPDMRRLMAELNER